ncbi:MAG: NTP transferase domain-containing protein [Chloroflexi bacterium]|nr:NTP transferase domain-containing protein [Chloroflexota bacterium]
MAWAAAVLAAGRSRRMQSRLAKVWHPVAGRPMAWHVIQALRGVGPSSIIVVVRPEDLDLCQALGTGLVFVPQEQPLGTGHALSLALNAFSPDITQVLVVNGDLPLITSATLGRLQRIHESRKAAFSFLTATVAQPGGLGRVRRDRRGRPVAIIEEREANDDEKGIKEVNAGAYCARLDWLREALPALQRRSHGEIYITDLAALASEQGQPLSTVSPEDAVEALGVNRRQDLARAEAAMRGRVVRQLLEDGVTIVDTGSAFIDVGVDIGGDTVLHPRVSLGRGTSIGAACSLGPDAIIRDSQLGDGCQVQGAVVEGYEVGPGVSIGPFSQLRAGVPGVSRQEERPLT